MRIRLLWRLAIVALLLMQFAIVVYLWPHDIYLSTKLKGMDFVTEAYHSEMGMVKSACYYNASNELVLQCFFHQYPMPLYGIPWRYSYAADEWFSYKDPKAGHWSRCSVVINWETSVILEDPNQDGVIEKCYVEPTHHTM